jgi:sulfate adenylyltransferase small subunit
MHIDTGHNYQEVVAFRDKRAAELGERLIVRSVEDSMKRGTVVLKHENESRNKHQSVTLLEAIEEFGFDACIGGARRDEEKARAKERIMSFRDEFGQWDPKNQRPELWNLYNARSHKGENIRAFPISNWTEMDVWQYIEREGLELPSIYFAHTRPVVMRQGAIVPVNVPLTNGELTNLPKAGEEIIDLQVRFRTVGDISCTARSSRTPTPSRRSCSRPPPPPSPSAAPPVWTTRPATPPWNNARKRVTSNERPSSRRPGLLRFLTCGSVDDGKSTLIGRLLFDTKTILADTLTAIEKTSSKRGMTAVDLSLLTDGLQAEREQGITIDVAYRYFSTGTRKYIIADAPGHEQYTRNMVTAASTANVAIILIDARKGVLTQTRRHSYLAKLVGIPTWSSPSTRWTSSITTRPPTTASSPTIPPSPTRSASPTCASSPVGPRRRHDRGPRRTPELVRRPDPDRHPRSRPRRPHREGRELPLPGSVRVPPQASDNPNCTTTAASWGASSRRDQGRRQRHGAAQRPHHQGQGHPALRQSIGKAIHEQSVTLLLEDEIDISRGDMIVNSDEVPAQSKQVEAIVCWLSETRCRRPAPTGCATPPGSESQGGEHRPPGGHQHPGQRGGHHPGDERHRPADPEAGPADLRRQLHRFAGHRRLHPDR